jgi:hypothetical protein
MGRIPELTHSTGRARLAAIQAGTTAVTIRFMTHQVIAKQIKCKKPDVSVW